MRLRLMGHFDLSDEEQPLIGLPRKTRALLAYLAMERPRSPSREEAGELLWPDRGIEQQRHSVRQCLAELRRATATEVIETSDGALRLAAGIAVDAAPLLALAQGLVRSASPDQLRTAVAAYSGSLLAGFPPTSPGFDDWLAPARARLEQSALEALSCLAAVATAAGDRDDALEKVLRMFEIDPLREDTHRRLLEACAAAGRRSEALRHYDAITALLKRELGVAPARETREVAERLRREAVRPTTPAAPRLGLGPPVAVLPFHDLTQPGIPSHLSDGLVADIICQLTGLREFTVISHGSTLGLTDPRLDLREAGRMLGARYLVRGAIRGDTRQMRLTMELADAATGTLLWARSHDIEGGLSFAEQDRAVSQIVNTLAPRIQEMELRRIRGVRPERLGVYDKVLLVREHLGSRDRERMVAARHLLTEVETEDPGYADAYALAADWHGLWIGQGWSAERERDILEVDRYSQQALALDPDNVRALTFYAHRKSLLHHDYDAARQMFARALDLSPSSDLGWLWSSLTYAYIGDAEEAVRRAHHALELSPRDRRLADFYSTLCIAHYTAGNWEEAASWGEKATGQPGMLRGNFRWTAASLVACGRTRDARDMARRGLQVAPSQTVRTTVAVHPYRDDVRRKAYGAHLIAAGFPP